MTATYLDVWRNPSRLDPQTHLALGVHLVVLTHQRAVDTRRQDRQQPRSAFRSSDLVIDVDVARPTAATVFGHQTVAITVGVAALAYDESIDDLFRRTDAAFYDTRKRR